MPRPSVRRSPLRVALCTTCFDDTCPGPGWAGGTRPGEGTHTGPDSGTWASIRSLEVDDRPFAGPTAAAPRDRTAG
ncbi:hypothetical protein HS99_0003030 [Kitasatospora aureofaciens]|uniref:Uncharacterized protein n=1 Tax=Kitasatospora aureofaciens TaxID=1894 RepID=A0A1E7NG32_KITAU|nr:hypothetical protein HS99_0003030 [Kitasatospora aureofaciens]